MSFVSGAVVAIMLLVMAIRSVAWLHQRHAPTIGGPFQLNDSNTGRRVTDRDFRGKWLLVFFGYMHCPDGCPTTQNEISDVVARFGPLAELVQPLFITLLSTPLRDTQQVLAEYTRAFDPPIVGLTGAPDQVAAAAKAYNV